MNYKKKYAAFYNSVEWRALRNLKFAEANGLCEFCIKNGKITAGKEIHHLEPIDKSWGRRYDINNLACLCSDCHNKAHSRISPLQEFNLFWEGLNDGQKGECGDKQSHL